MQYIEIHKPNLSSHQIHLSSNIVSNSAAAIDTQITKPFWQSNLYEIVPIIIKPKSLRNQIYTETNASNSRAQGLDLFRKLCTHDFILLAKD